MNAVRSLAANLFGVVVFSMGEGVGGLLFQFRVWEIVFSLGLCFVFCLTIIAVITTFFSCDILAFRVFIYFSVL